jgi:hypothetical protein
MLFCRQTAPHLAAFYLAIARSAVSPSPFLRGPSPNYGRTKKPDQALRQQIPRWFVAVDMPNTCVTYRQIERSHDAGAAAAVPVVCRSGAGRRQAVGSWPDLVISGVVNSGRERGHGIIDADPKET